MPESCEHLSRATDLLRRPLEVTNARRATFSTGSSIQDEIVTTNRLILITQGELLYTIENSSRRISAGTQLFVPAWVRRVWSVPQAGPCEMMWCEFDSADTENAGVEMAHRKLNQTELRREAAAFNALLRLRLRPKSPSPWERLRLEASLKVMLVRFLAAADSLDAAPPADVHPQVKAMLRWLQDHFCERNALETLYARSGLTPNYFRKHFRAATLYTPQEYIERLRLRHARYLLRTTHWQLKRIAVEIGYDDPLYFSRLYRRFWKRPPSDERTL